MQTIILTAPQHPPVCQVQPVSETTTANSRLASVSVVCVCVNQASLLQMMVPVCPVSTATLHCQHQQANYCVIDAFLTNKIM